MPLKTDSSKSLTFGPDLPGTLVDPSSIDSPCYVRGMCRLLVEHLLLRLLFCTIHLVFRTILVHEMMTGRKKATTDPDYELTV